MRLYHRNFAEYCAKWSRLRLKLVYTKLVTTFDSRPMNLIHLKPLQLITAVIFAAFHIYWVVNEGKERIERGGGRVMLHKKYCVNAAIVLGMVGDLGVLPYKGGEETSSRPCPSGHVPHPSRNKTHPKWLCRFGSPDPTHWCSPEQGGRGILNSLDKTMCITYSHH